MVVVVVVVRGLVVVGCLETRAVEKLLLMEGPGERLQVGHREASAGAGESILTVVMGAGGGGYSGGGAAAPTAYNGAGGGEGSYNAGTSLTAVSGANSDNGLVTITYTIPTQPIRYVKQGGSGTGDGTSWDNASGDLQSQINIAGAQQVWVAGGRYTTLNSNGSNGSFRLKNGVAVYGGFVGNETNLRPAVSPIGGQVSSTTLTTTSTFQAVIHNNNNGLDNTARLDGVVITGATILVP